MCVCPGLPARSTAAGTREQRPHHEGLLMLLVTCNRLRASRLRAFAHKCPLCLGASTSIVFVVHPHLVQRPPFLFVADS